MRKGRGEVRRDRGEEWTGVGNISGIEVIVIVVLMLIAIAILIELG